MGALYRGLVRVLTLLVGRWDPPPWVRAGGRGVGAAGRWARDHKARAAVLVALLGLLGAGAGWGWFWYQHRPKPTEFTVSLTAPGITSPEPGSAPGPLVIDFGGSVAPLKLIGKSVDGPAAPTLSPPTEGRWSWTADTRLSFAPKADWPIGRKFKVKLPRRNLVRDGVLLAEHELAFETPPFTARAVAAEFHQDPTDPSLKKVVATIAFSHPVDAAAFEKRVRMHLDGRLRTDAGTDYQFHTTYDKYRLAAYLHSQPVAVPEKDLTFRVTVDKGVPAARGSDGTPEPIETTVTVPGVASFFRVSSLALTLVDNQRFEPEQVMILSTSTGVQQKELGAALSAFVLPLYDPRDAEEAKKKRPHAWRDAEQIGPEILKQAQPLKIAALPSEKEYDTQHTFRYQAEPGRYVYVAVKKGVRAFGGYLLGETWQASERVGDYPAVLHIMQSGALVSLGGSKKVSLYARDVDAVRFQLGRVLPDQLHHLVSQSGGQFASPNFLHDYSFSDENLVERFEEVQPLPKLAHGKPRYFGFDLSKYLAGAGASGGGDRRGLFFLKAESWDAAARTATGESDSRLILVTDLGVIVKDAADGSHDVFVQSIRDGTPVAGAEVQVIGKNGQPVATATTDGSGRAGLASLKDFQREKTPLLYLVRKGGDSAFLPLSRSDRYLDLSRFDVGGIHETTRTGGLSAFLFSDRGLYRPGDEIRAVAIVKAREWKQSLAGLPLQLEITDPRGLTVRRDAVKLDAHGLVEVRHAPPETAPTGAYTINLRTVKDGQPANLLGSTTVRVREFLPDRMKISAHLSNSRSEGSLERAEGWVTPAELAGRVTLKNLYGTAAEGHKVRASITLTPGLPTFNQLRDFRFFDPKSARSAVTDTLEETETDGEGEAEFPLKLERFDAATYRLTFTAEGFEAAGGRSVVAESSVMVSPLPYLVGYKADGELDYMSRGTRRSVELLAVGPRGAPIAASGLRQILIARGFVSVLVRQDNGTYKYQSVRRESELSSQPLALAAQPLAVTLPTGKAGDFALLVRGASGEELQRIEYSVAGDADLSRSLEKNAELQIALKSVDVQPGGELELSIRAPYAGAGLITIERDRVYAHRWFKSDTSASVQTIRVPPELEGNGYVSVTFVRDVNSPEVFSSPLSYGVQPFFVSRGRRAVQIDLASPATARPGDDFTIRYHTDRPAKIVLFAVDEGVLRVADYKTPDPLGFFFQKRALDVRTAQILDLLLPEFERLAQAAPGGDSGGEGALGANLNPFKRRRDKPVAFWSGLLDAGAKERDYTIRLPDSFNGTLRVMAVAVAAEAVGAGARAALVRGDFVISPNVPTFAAPGDEFEVGVSVANNVVGSGDKAKLTLALDTSPHLEVVGDKQVSLAVAEGHEAATAFRVRARDQLGSATLGFVASLGDRRSRLATDLSLRPASAYATTFVAGHLRDGEVTVPASRSLYPEFRTLRAGVSHLPLGLAHGLAGYLEKFPHGCTEQIVSQAVPALVLGDKPDFGFDAASARASVEQVIATLRSRQNDDGAFGLWAANPATARFPSAWALHLLTEAKERGFAVPPDVMKSGLAWLQSIAAEDGDGLDGDRLRAYAIYLLARHGVITTAFAAGLQKKLEANYPQQWQNDLAGALLASTLRLLKSERAAAGIEGQRFGSTAPWSEYHDGLVHDAFLLYLLARHFPERAQKLGAVEINQLVQPIYRGSYNTLGSALTILALEAYGRAAAAAPGGGITLAEVLDSGQRRALPLSQSLLPRVSFSGEAKAIQVVARGGFDGYYMVSESGFLRQPPAQELKRKLEVYREYTGLDGKPLARIRLGDEILVHIQLRSLVSTTLHDLAIVDLLPGGFEVVVKPGATASGSDDSAGEGEGEGEGENEGEGEGGEEGGEADESDQSAAASRGAATAGGGGFALPIAEAGTTFSPDYGDVREDRVVLYGTATASAQQFVYRIKATSAGRFSVAPILADSMYDRSVLARGVGGHLAVEKP